MDDYIKVKKLFEKSNRFIITAIDNEGYPHSKCVLPSLKMISPKEMYFVTNTHSKYVSYIKNNSKSSVYFYNSLFYNGCLIQGNSYVVEDLEIKKSLWKKGYASAYPNPELAYQDPDFCVVKFEGLKIRFYSDFNPRDVLIEE